MMMPAVVIIVAVLVSFGNCQTTTTMMTSTSSMATTTTIVQGANVPIASLLSQSSISTIFYQYWNTVASGMSLGSGTYTLFVPTNTAWNSLSATDQATLTSCLSSSCTNLPNVIKYHMWSGAFTSSLFSSLTSSGVCQTTQDGLTNQCATYAFAVGSSASAHVAFKLASNSWYINGARIILADQQATNFVVHFIDRWLYPVDTGTTAQAFALTAINSPSPALVTTGCALCSSTFGNLWNTFLSSSGTMTSYYYWMQNNAGSSANAAVTMFIPLQQSSSSQYSINTLASILTSMSASGSSGNLTALANVLGAHVIVGRILYLNPWIASGTASYPCGPAATLNTGVNQYSCTLVQYNSSTWAIEVGNTASIIVYPNIPVENGVVHIVSNVLNFVYGNLMSVVNIHPFLTKYKQYLNSDSTGTALGFLNSGTNQYTVFAPDDNSWGAAATAFTSNASLQAAVLQLGIVPSQTLYSSLVSQTTVSPLAWAAQNGVYGNRLRYVSSTYGMEVDGGFSSGFQQTTLTTPDIGATNGVLHVVTGNAFGVTSMTISQFILSRPDLTMSASYLSQLVQGWQLFANSGTYTVLVPNNNAWNVLNQNSVLSTITRGSSSNVLLVNLLLRHYTGTNAQLYGSLGASSSFTAMTLNGVITFSATSASPAQYQVSYGSATSTVNASDYLCTNGRVHILNTVLAVQSDAYNLNTANSCQNPSTCSASAVFVNLALIVCGIIFGFVNRR